MAILTDTSGVELTVTEEVGEAQHEANKGGGHGEEREQLHGWLVKHNTKLTTY